MYLKFLFPKDHHVERKMLSHVQGARLLPLEEDCGESLSVGDLPFRFQLSVSIARARRGKRAESSRASLCGSPPSPQSDEDPCPLPGSLEFPHSPFKAVKSNEFLLFDTFSPQNVLSGFVSIIQLKNSKNNNEIPPFC